MIEFCFPFCSDQLVDLGCLSLNSNCLDIIAVGNKLHRQPDFDPSVIGIYRNNRSYN